MSASILVTSPSSRDRSWIRELLSYNGYSVDETVPGKLSPAGYDLIIVDAGEDTFVQTREVRSAVPSTMPVLAVTEGASDPGPAIEAGADGLLSKPFSAHKLLSSVRALVHRAPDRGRQGRRRQQLIVQL